MKNGLEPVFILIAHVTSCTCYIMYRVLIISFARHGVIHTKYALIVKRKNQATEIKVIRIKNRPHNLLATSCQKKKVGDKR